MMLWDEQISEKHRCMFSLCEGKYFVNRGSLMKISLKCILFNVANRVARDLVL